MDWDAIGAVGEILGAIGVIGSVLYLAFQVRSDRDATLANTRQLRQNGVRESMLTMASSELLTPALSKIGSPHPGVQALMDEFHLTREEATRVGAFNTAVMRQLETNLRMPMSETELEQTYETIRSQLRGQTGIWWAANQGAFSAEFIRKVEDLTRDDR